VGQVLLFLKLVLVGCTSLRGAGRLFPLLAESLHVKLGTPDWTTGRYWLLRVGLGKLLAPKEQGDDWVWLIDHSAQIGQEKCLVILGVRASQLPAPGTCLRHEDLQVIHLRVLKDPDGQAVYRELEAAAKQTGVPRAIVDDHGADIHGGVKLFQEQHSQTIEIYDITHKCACLLKHRLEKDRRWSEFMRQVGQTKVAVLQTELACLAPPLQRVKSRYMNLATLLGWATSTLALVDQPSAELLKKITPERLHQKLGWLPSFRNALREWSEWQAVVTTTESLVRRFGLSVTRVPELAQELEPLAWRNSTCELAQELVSFVATQASQLRPGERLPASTEVLESCFGKLKVLEKDQAKNGFTGMVLSLGAMVWKTTTETVHRALEICSVNTVQHWMENNLAMTVQRQRRLVYNHG